MIFLINCSWPGLCQIGSMNVMLKWIRFTELMLRMESRELMLFFIIFFFNKKS